MVGKEEEAKMESLKGKVDDYLFGLLKYLMKRRAYKKIFSFIPSYISTRKNMLPRLLAAYYL